MATPDGELQEAQEGEIDAVEQYWLGLQDKLPKYQAILRRVVIIFGIAVAACAMWMLFRTIHQVEQMSGGGL